MTSKIAWLRTRTPKGSQRQDVLNLMYGPARIQIALDDRAFRPSGIATGVFCEPAINHTGD